MRTVNTFTFPNLLGSRPFAATAALLLVVAATARAANPGEWPNWRGPEANASLATGKYPVKWDATNVLWKVSLPGKGGSTPIVRSQRIYLVNGSLPRRCPWGIDC